MSEFAHPRALAPPVRSAGPGSGGTQGPGAACGHNTDRPDWIRQHQAAWQAKPGLADYYRREIFGRIEAALAPIAAMAGPRLEIGTGPGFLARHRGDLLSIDLTAHAGVSVCADVHALPFAAGSLAAVVGIDVLHHLARPGTALSEIDRCLAPGGRLVLIEPWAGLLGWVFYRHVHHEDCAVVADPFGAAFPPGKSAMDGNAWLPRAVLWDRPAERNRCAPALRSVSVVRFGGLSYLLTGGFQPWGAPAGLTRGLAAAERLLPDRLRGLVCVRGLFVFEKVMPDSTHR